VALQELHWLGPAAKSDQEEHMKRFVTFFLTIAVTVVLTLAFSAMATRPAPVAAAATPVPHPHIHEALEAMRGAKHELETADHDFHGHRVKSIEHLDQAIHEAEVCEQEP
jgi:hypothetical protein